MSLSVEGEKVIKTVMYKDELYSGDLYEDAPDFVALSHEGYDLKGSINKNQIAGTGFLTGGHTRENAVFFINKKIDQSDINIVDVGPTIMALLIISGNSLYGKCLL